MPMILGPIVGHTDTESSRVWIRVNDNPNIYTLRIPTVGTFPFVSTEPTVELGTALALVTGLRPDRYYRYQILRNNVRVGRPSDSLRTMPREKSREGVSFAQVSCNSNTDIGCWPDLLQYIRTGEPPEKQSVLRTERPRFLLMLGDQVYLDQKFDDKGEDADVWTDHFNSPRTERRAAIAQWYQQNWGRHEIREVMANIPTYMMWDDHDIRNGWGSLAHDSPTIAGEYPDNVHLYEKYNEIFEDCRYVYWHFQRSHGPAPGSQLHPIPRERKALPSLFRVGRTLILMLDTRGDRDVFRDEDKRPALGEDQWSFIKESLSKIPQEIDYLIITTAAPIAHVSKKSMSQWGSKKTRGSRRENGEKPYDVELFKKGLFVNKDGKAFDGSSLKVFNERDEYPHHIIMKYLTDIRDQWPHKWVRKEQKDLITLASKARFSNRGGAHPRSLVFVAGDVHFGGNYKVTVQRSVTGKKKSDFRCYFSSGIGKKLKDGVIKWGKFLVRTKIKFKVAKGIRSKIQVAEWRMNIGIIQTSTSGKNNFKHSHQSTKEYSSDKGVRRKQKKL